jgi:hypothetical protein
MLPNPIAVLDSIAFCYTIELADNHVESDPVSDSNTVNNFEPYS